MSEITKLEAARRQLDCAIRLFFEDDDSLAIHMLAHAAFKVLFDIYPKRRNDGYANQLRDMIARSGWTRFNHIPNFLKHADNDPDHVIDEHSADAVQGTLGLATILHHRITGRMTPEMRAFDSWMHLMYPDEFKLEPDPDPEFEAEFRRSNLALRERPRSTRLVLGKALMDFYRRLPDHPGGFGAPRDPDAAD